LRTLLRQENEGDRESSRMTFLRRCLSMASDIDVVLLVQALLDHCNELRQEIVELRTAAKYVDINSDLVYDIRDYPAYREFQDILYLHYD
jgi:hypothetical protein